MPRVSPAQLRALVAAYRKPGDRRGSLAIGAEPYWDGPAMLDAPGGVARVAACPSPLAVRAAMVDHDGDGLAIEIEDTRSQANALA